MSVAALLGVVPAAAQPASPVLLQAPPQERAAALVRPAIVYIKAKFTANVLYNGRSFAYLNDGEPWEVDVICTGFGVNPNGYIATAGHCVDPTGSNGIKYNIVAQVIEQFRDHPEYDPTISVESYIKACLASCTVQGEVSGSPPDAEISVFGGATVNGSRPAQPARVVESRPADQGDVALLKIDVTDQPSIELGGTPLQVGTPVLSIGYLAGATQDPGLNLEPSSKDGQISSKKTFGAATVYETSAAMSEGMSGGPTIDLDGHALGLNSFKLAGEAESFSFIAPARELSELLDSNGVPNQLGPNDLTYRQGLADYFSGHYTSAIDNFDKLLAVSPNHPQALQYKTRAVQDRAVIGDPGLSVPLWVLIGAPALAIFAAVATVLLLRRRGRRRQTEPSDPLPPGPVPNPMSGRVPISVLPNTTANAQPEPMLNVSPTVGFTQPAATAKAAGLTAEAGFCFNCATARIPSARFCPNCGVPQS